MARWRRQTDMDMIFMTIEKKNSPSLNTLFPLLSYGAWRLGSLGCDII